MNRIDLRFVLAVLVTAFLAAAVRQPARAADPAAPAGTLTLTGTWVSDTNFDVDLTQSGSSVTGKYSAGTFTGTISGTEYPEPPGKQMEGDARRGREHPPVHPRRGRGRACPHVDAQEG